MADTTIKLSGTYDSIEAYELLEEMRGVASDYLPLTGGEISGDLIVDGQLSADLTGNVTGNVTGTASGNLPLSGGTVTGGLTVEGTITGNLAGNADTATNATNAVNATKDGNGNTITATYLPLAGGTMTGGITTSYSDFIVKENNTSHLTISGGASYSNSASVRLAGGDETGQTGLFQLRSQDGVNSKDLIGKPSGEFTWGGSNVAVMGTLQNGHGILTGSVSNISVAANGYKTGTVNFGQTYSSAPIVVANCSYGHAHACVGCYSVTTTGFSYIVSNESNGAFSNEKISWIAIG